MASRPFSHPAGVFLDVVHHPHRPFVSAMAAGVEQLCSGRKRKLQRDYRQMTTATPAFSSRGATNNVP